jgi:hypothetical protein
MNSGSGSLFSRRPNSRASSGKSVTGKISTLNSTYGRKTKRSTKNSKHFNRSSTEATDNVSSVATLLKHTEIFPCQKVLTQPSSLLDASTRITNQSSFSSSRSVLGQQSLNTCLKTKPVNRIHQLHASGWGGKRAAGAKDWFVNIKVKNLRTNKLGRIAEYCISKICVIDFWMTKHGSSSIVSMDAWSPLGRDGCRSNIDQLHQRASSSVLQRHLFKGRVRFITINVDSNSTSAENEIQDTWKSSNMTHLWTGEEGVRSCHVQFVPQRVILSPTGEIIHWWDGSHGNVVDGKHGKSRINNSTNLADVLDNILRKYFPGDQ